MSRWVYTLVWLGICLIPVISSILRSGEASMFPLTETQFLLLAIHALIFGLCVLSFVDDVRARAAKACLSKKDILKPLRPGDVAIIHFDHAISDRLYAGLEQIFDGRPDLRDGRMVVIGGCRSVAVLQLAEKFDRSPNDGNSGGDELSVAGDKPIEARSEPA